MNKQKIFNIISKIVICFTIALCFGLIIYCFITEKGAEVKIQCDNSRLWTDNWILNDNEVISFPFQIHEEEGNMYSLSNTLPDVIKTGDAISFPSHNTKFKVYVDDDLVYSFGDGVSSAYEKLIGETICIVPFNGEHAGKKIKIEITPLITLSFNYFSFLYGNKDIMTQHYLQSNMKYIAIIIVLLMISIVSLSQAIQYALSKCDKEYHIFLYYALGEISIAIWILLQSNILQFITTKTIPFVFLHYIFLLLMPCLITGLYKYLLQNSKKIFWSIELIGYLLIIICACSFALECFEPRIIKSIIHGYVLLHVIVSLFICVRYYRKGERNIEDDNFVFNIFFTEIIMSFLLITFFFGFGNKIGIEVLVFGTIILSIRFFYIIFKKQIRNREVIFESNAYKELTYTDPLTNIGNRQRLEMNFNELISKLTEEQSISFIMCDMNYLKKVNDEFGHSEGDKLIVGASQCLSNACGDIATCYRLGGDEFCILMIENNNSCDRVIERLYNEISVYNANNDHHISMAIGSVTEKVRKDVNFFQDMYQKADKNMYDDKQKIHAASSH